MGDIDDLTGLLQRAAFFHRLDEAIASSALHGSPLCLLVVDLDYLKSINDQYGHLAGDAALQTVANALRPLLRGGDAGGRYGGDEFVVLLPDASLEGGQAVAERLRAAVSGAACLPPGGTVSLRLSLSIGIAAYPTHGRDSSALFAAADRGVYAAKEAGRNAVRIATAQVVALPTSALGPAPQGRLVGRQEQLRRLRTLAEAACQGRGSVVIVEGEAGIGKTRLVEELAGLATMLGMAVARSRCHQVELGQPYHPFLEALSPLIETLPEETLGQAAGIYAGELARLVPALLQRLPECVPLAPLPPEEDRMRLQQALCHLLAGLARAPLLLLVDDLHWADEASTRVLNRLAWQIGETGLLLVCTVRSEDLEANPPVVTTLVNMERQGRCERLVLSPLGRAEMSTLLRMAVGLRWPPDPLQRQLIEETGGNPLFLLETVRLLIARKVLREYEGEWQTAPGPARPADILPRIPLSPTVHAVIEARLSRLDEHERTTLAVAAMLGRHFDPELLAAVLARTGGAQAPPEDEVYLTIEQLERQHLLRASTSPTTPDSYEFSHPLIHEAAYQSIGAARRKALHRHAAAILQQRAAPPGKLAEHAWQGEQWEQARDLFVRAAAEAAAVHAVQSAIAYLERAIAAGEHWPAAGAGDRAARLGALHEQLADLRELDGDWQGALAAYEKALALGAADPRWMAADHARLWCKVGDLRGRGRDVDLALAAYKAATANAESTAIPAAIQATILLGRARIAYLRAAYADAASLAAAARDLLGAEPRDAELDARGINALGNAAQGQGNLDQAAAWFGQGMQDAEAAGQERWVAHFAHHLARVVWQQGDLASGERYLLQSLALAERIGDQHIQANCQRTLGVLAAVRGHRDQAEEWYRHSLAVAERGGDPFGMAAAHHNLGVMATYDGHFDEAAAEFERGLRVAEELEDRRLIGTALNGLGSLALDRGDVAAAERFLRRSLVQCEEIGNPSTLGHVLYLLGRLALERGSLEDSAAFRGRARALSGMDPEDILHIDLLDARALLRQDHPREAATALHHILERCEAVGMVELAIEGQLLLAEAYLGVGQEQDAEQTANAALERARRRGARTQVAMALRLAGLTSTDREAGRRLLNESLAEFTTLGVEHEVERTSCALAERDARDHVAVRG